MNKKLYEKIVLFVLSLNCVFWVTYEIIKNSTSGLASITALLIFLVIIELSKE